MEEKKYRVVDREITILHCTECESTQEKIKEFADNRWLVLQADRQSAGRGRRGRNWASPSGGLYFTFSYPFSDNIPPQLQLLGAALVLRDVLRLRPGVEDKFSLKWPNDLLYRGRKIAGFLGEAKGDSIYLGCGLNVNNSFGPDYSEYRRVPVSLHEISGDSYSRERILLDWLEKFVRALAGGRDEYFNPRFLAPEIDTIGRQVKAARVEGQAVGLSADGGLLLSAGGEKKVVHAGDVQEVYE
ncbi:MAG: biotin--[acetyl-CoA-carboxylase] ligase [bacterium]